jgi:integrase
VNISTREISVNKTYSINDHLISTTKTDTSDRIIYMQDELFLCVKKIKSYVRLLKHRYVFQTGIFFPNDDGGYISYDAYRQYLGDMTEKYIGRRLTPHALRHTHTAMLAEAGVPLDDISRRLGHADSEITREVYLHVTSKMQEQARQRIQKITIL